MKKLFLILVILLVPLMAKAGVYNNSGTTAEDSICFTFCLLDTLADPVVAIAGDSLWIFVYYPGGALALRDSARIITDARVTSQTLDVLGQAMGFYTFKEAVAAIDGGGQEGTYKYILVAADSSLELETTYHGEFQVYATMNYSDRLDSATVDGSDLADLSFFADMEEVGESLYVYLEADSGVDSRINQRQWGLQVGAAGSDDSITYAERVAAINQDSILQALDYTNNSANVVRLHQIADTAAIKALVADTVDTEVDEAISNAFTFTSGAVQSDLVRVSGSNTAADNFELIVNDDSTDGGRFTLDQFYIKNTMPAGSHAFYIEADNGAAAYWLSDYNTGGAFTIYSSSSANGAALLALANGSASDGMRLIGTARAADFSSGSGILGNLEGTVDGVDAAVEAYFENDTIKHLYEYIDGISDSMDEASQVTGTGTGPDTLDLYVFGITDGDTAAIAGAGVCIWEGATKRTAWTDNTGNIAFGLSAGTYTCAVEDGHWHFSTTTVTAPGGDTIYGTAPIVTGSSSPDQATVYGQIHVDGDPANRYWVQIELTRPDTLTVDDIYISFNHKYWTDSTGLWQAQVYYLSGDTASFYYRYLDQTGRELFFRPVDTTTVNINDIWIPKP